MLVGHYQRSDHTTDNHAKFTQSSAYNQVIMFMQVNLNIFYFPAIGTS